MLKHLSAVWGIFLYDESPEGELLLGQEFEHFILIAIVKLPSDNFTPIYTPSRTVRKGLSPRSLIDTKIMQFGDV